MEKKENGKEITVMNKGSWSKEEDQTLFNYVTSHGEGKWQKVAQNAGLRRCGKSCRQRWLNYLKPGIKRGDISPDEEDLIIRLHRLLGNRWALIAKRLPGRTDNEIKNYWNINLSKKLRRQRQLTSTTLSPILASNPLLSLTSCWASEDRPIKREYQVAPDQTVHSRPARYWLTKDSRVSQCPFLENQKLRKTKHVINVVTPKASGSTTRVNEAIKTYSNNNTRGSPGSSNQIQYGPMNNHANFPISNLLTNDDYDDQIDDQNQILMPENLKSHGDEEGQNKVLPEKLIDPIDTVLDVELKRVAYFLGLEDECT